ncbi:MAG TPA: helix-turn-helix transcriptional regulator [Trichormus sp.]
MTGEFDAKEANRTRQVIDVCAEVIREQREHTGVSQNALARLSGIHRSYIGDLERGNRNVSIRSLSRLALALGLKPSKVLAAAEKRITERRSKAVQVRPRFRCAQTACSGELRVSSSFPTPPGPPLLFG